MMKEHILPYKDKPELLLQPPAEYNFIPFEDWRKLVSNRLSIEFEIKSRKGKERRAKYILSDPRKFKFSEKRQNCHFGQNPEFF